MADGSDVPTPPRAARSNVGSLQGFVCSLIALLAALYFAFNSQGGYSGAEDRVDQLLQRLGDAVAISLVMYVPWRWIWQRKPSFWVFVAVANLLNLGQAAKIYLQR